MTYPKGERHGTSTKAFCQGLDQECCPYMPNLGSQLHPHGLEEAHVVHQPDPSHLEEVW